MAKVTLKSVTKTLVIKTVTVALTEQEAKTLGLVLARVGGSPTNSRRKHTDSIGEALQTVMGDPFYYPEKKYIDRENRSLSFDDEVDFDKKPE
jgi:hypothetical protein